jgi:CDP-glycerol glycerophosphotransferase (TagB/SpsB family)
VSALVHAGFNVIVKLHDRSLDPDPRYNEGIDWRARFETMAAAARGQIAFATGADATPLLAAADVMITDHSSVGFEYLVLDRPLIVFDAPDLPRAARVNPEKVALLRSAATVVASPEDAGRAAIVALADPERLSAARRRVARDLFFEPGGATARAAALVRGMLAPSLRSAATPIAAGPGTS